MLSESKKEKGWRRKGKGVEGGREGREGEKSPVEGQWLSPDGFIGEFD